METATVVAKKCSTCFYGPLDEDREPCRDCIAGGTFVYWKPTNPASTNTSQTGLGLGREIGHDHNVPSSESELPTYEAGKNDAGARITCREAIRLLEQIDRELRTMVANERRKAIKKLLGILKEIPKPTTTIVTIPANPQTCPIDELERVALSLSHGKGRER